MKKIYFASKSEKKFDEVEKFGVKDGVKIEYWPKELVELQINDVEKLIKDKAKQAFKEVRRPVLVEHTALIISAFKGLPELQTSYFYSKMGCKEIVEFCNYKKDFCALAKSFFCLCDGKHFYIGEGEEEGYIKKRLEKHEENTKAFDWDIIFIPKKNNPQNKTYAELNKNKRSMRKSAWESLKSKNNLTWSDFLEDDEEKQQEQRYLEELASLIKQKKVILFVGAGISASVKLPTWSKLIGELGKIVGYEEELFEVYGDNMMLAEYIHKEKKEELHKIIQKNVDLTDEVRIELYNSKIYRIISELNFPVIYTTNYDILIEEYFKEKKKPFSKVACIEDMEKVKDNTTRIMKFHGDIAKEKTIVLSESQYFERMNFQSFLDIQLQADMLKYHVLFLGYSMSDINIKLLLYLAKKRWIDNKNDLKAYIYTATPNEVQKEVFEKNGIITFSGQEADKEVGTLDFLKKLKKLCKKKS